MQLAGKTALITGAARGIGRAIAAAYVRNGANVAIADIDIERARETALAVPMNVTDQDSLELIRHRFNVNAISPGVVDGEHWDGVDAFFARYENKAPGQKKKEVGDAVPYGRMGTPDDPTGMAVFLTSHAADYIVAQTYNVDGGQWMS